MTDNSVFLRFPNASFCEMCFQNAEYIGEIFEGHDLILHEGTYKVIKSHDEIFRFQSIPIKNPCDKMTDEEIDIFYRTIPNLDDTYTQYCEEFRKTFRFHPQTGKDIVDACVKAGFNPENDGWLEYWIVHRAAIFIGKYYEQRSNNSNS